MDEDFKRLERRILAHCGPDIVVLVGGTLHMVDLKTLALGEDLTRDKLAEHRERMVRKYHRSEPAPIRPDNPVMRPKRDWEQRNKKQRRR